MNECGEFSAAAHSHVLVQPRSYVPLALPIDPDYSRCLFPGHSTELPLYYFFCTNFFLISSISMSVSHLYSVSHLDLPNSICLSLLSYRKNSYFIPYFLHSLSISSFCGLTPYTALSYNLVYCLFPLYSLFSLIRCFMTTCLGRIQYPMHAGRDTFTTSGPSPIKALIFNSLI